MVTAIKRVLDDYENRVGFTLKPDRRFYETVKINQKRFGQLIRGEKEPVASEMLRLSKFFNVPLEKLVTQENGKPGQ